MKITKQYLERLIEQQLSIALKERGAGGSYAVGSGKEDKKVILARSLELASKAIKFNNVSVEVVRDLFDAVVAVHPELASRKFH